MELFDYINNLSHGKKNNFIELPDKEQKKFPAYLINRYFSFFPDTIFAANLMNRYPFLDNRMKHDFYLYSVRKKKRFTKWLKSEEIENISLLMKVYECSERKAKEYLSILTDDQITLLKNTYHHLNNHKP